MSYDGMAWHTPADLDEGGSACRCYCVPVALLPMFNDVLDQLAYEYNWFQVGETVDDTVSKVRDFLMTFGICNVGMVAPFVQSSMNPGWLKCNGAVYSREDYPELWEVIPPHKREGDYFVVPDLRDRFVYGQGPGALAYDYGGAEEVVLTIGEMPPHSHVYQESIISDIDLELTGAPQPVYNAPKASNTSNTGEGRAHENMPPYVTLTYWIYTGRIP